MNAAIGMAAGLGSYTIATVGAVITLIVLSLLAVMERFVEKRGGRE